MKWIRLENGDWQAQGKNGDFLVWKTKNGWFARYRSVDHKKHFFIRPATTKISEIKELCQKNHYWEDGTNGKRG